MSDGHVPQTTMAPSLPTVGRRPALVNAVTKRCGIGVTTRTESPWLSAVNSSTLVSAMSLPRPMTISRSAVRAISVIRWLDTRTVRPSAASPRSRWRTQRMPSGSRPLTGSSKSRTPGSPSQRARHAEALAHAERERAGPPVRHGGQPDEVEHFVDPGEGDVVGPGQAAQVVPGAAPGMERLGVEQRAHVAQRPAQLAEADAVDGGGARVGHVEAQDHAHRRGLARAVRAEEAGDHARGDAEAETVDGHSLAIALGQSCGDDHGSSFECHRGPGTQHAVGRIDAECRYRASRSWC